MKKSLVVLVGLLVMSSIVSACAPSAPKKMTIATASMGGAYYPIGTGIAEIVSKNVKGVTMTAEVTGGAVENCRLVGNKEADVGITNANTAYFAYNGTDPYKEKYNIRALGSLHSTILHIIVLDKSPIKTVADLKGKRVAVGPAGGGSIPIFKDLLSVYGMTLDDVKASYLSYDDGMMALKDGNVDAALAAAGYPTSAVMQLTNTDKVRFVEVDSAKFDELVKKFPYYSKVTVPAATYKMDKDAVAVGVNNVLIVNAGMDEKTAYNLTAAIYNNLAALGEYHASVKQVTLQSAAQSPIPFHPGAEKYFREKGLIK
ncbi:MAG TPA: TAXI family TRAP transporter solute-binding subunit [Firmicutes bacterium]|nr:TAXI family TRAP transporter solute-binding subunit [Candidatus Fermentithermobacillaceae bacterium]